MRKLRVLALSLFTIILIFALVGCSEDNASKDNNNPPSDNEQIDQNDETTDNNNENAGNENDEEEVFEAIDLDGRVIKIANHWDMTPESGTELRDKIIERHDY